MSKESIEEMAVKALEGKSNNFKLAYALAYQYAGSGQGSTADPSNGVRYLFQNLISAFDDTEAKQG